MFVLTVWVWRNITGIKDGAGTSGGVEGQRGRRDIDDSPANPNSNQVDIVEWWSPGVFEKRGKFDPLGLGRRPKSQGAREIKGLEAG